MPVRRLFSAQLLGLVVLGVTSVYREGFEVVLFLQSLQLKAGTTTLMEGVALGLAGTAAVGVAIFFLERKLPYRRMLVLTGILLGVVLVVMARRRQRARRSREPPSVRPLPSSFPS